MGKVTGFLEFPREGPSWRPVELRRRDWREVYEPTDESLMVRQAARCMDCGIPFCMQGCPLGNRIPAFNDHVYRSRWAEAADQLFATNNFPEFTGRLCPAPCESACVLGISSDPVTIERVEYEIAEHAFTRGWPVAKVTSSDSGRRVAIVGSGPSGLAAAAQLRSAGHEVTVFERADAIGGLLRYGIPEFKLEKAVLDRRLEVMRQHGVRFRTGAPVGEGATALAELQRNHDAVILAIGATVPRRIDVPGATLRGVMPAMEFLESANRAVATSTAPAVDAAGLRVVILGGGDTGADCLGTAHRQGAASVVQIEIMDRPPLVRPADQPWPTMPRLFKTTSAHDEGGERRFSAETLEFLGDGHVEALRLRDNRSGEVQSLGADLVLVAAGFTGPQVSRLGLGEGFVTPRATLSVDAGWRLGGLPGPSPVFACGDAVRGQSLIVWAIAEGRSAAAAVDAHLTGAPSALPSPVTPYSQSW